MRILFISVIGLVLSIFSVLHTKADEEIIIAIDGDIAPYVYQKDLQGIDVDIIKKAAELGGLKIRFLIAPYNRLDRLFITKKVDATVHYMASAEDGFVSKKIRHWFNGIVIRKGVDASRENWKNLSWGTFPDALEALGDEANEIQKYIATAEVIDNAPQVVKMIHGRRLDIYVGDMLAFRWLFERLRPKESNVEFELIKTYKPTPHYLVFQNRENRDAFDRGLEKLKAGGYFEWILIQHVLFGDVSKK